MRPTLLIVGAGPLQLPAYHEARDLGLRVIAVDRDPSAPGMALADVPCPVDTRDVNGVTEVARRESVNGAVTICTDYPVMCVAAVNEALGLVGIRPPAARRATHKGEMRDAFARAGAPVPGYRRVRSLDEARQAAAEIGLPCIFKPPTGSGSRGVYRPASTEDFARAFEHAKAVDPSEPEILVEQYIAGPEVSVETISHAGRHHIIAMTDKRTTGDPYWVELGHVEPSSLPSEVQEAIVRTTESGLEALGIRDAASHVEIRVGPQGPRLIEIGARLGGDYITTELVRRSTGVNMVRAVIEMALGRVPDLSPRWARGAAIRYLRCAPGRVRAISGAEHVRGLPGVALLYLGVGVGNVVRPIQSSHDRPGHVICEGRDAGEAEQRACMAADMVCIETEDT